MCQPGICLNYLVLTQKCISKILPYAQETVEILQAKVSSLDMSSLDQVEARLQVGLPCEGSCPPQHLGRVARGMGFCMLQQDAALSTTGPFIFRASWER